MVSFAAQYPHLGWWIEFHGFIELGEDGYSHSLLRILDEGGMYFEDKSSKNLDDALAAGEAFLVTELPERFLVRWNAETSEFEDI